MKKRNQTNNKYLLLEDPVINTFVNDIRKKLGDQLKNLYLFGSRAKGDAWEGSDYDIAFVVNYRDRKLEDTVLDVSTFILNQFDVLISAQIFTEEEWALENRLPLGMNIVKEGIAF